MKRIAIFGKGGFGREVQMLIEQINLATPVWEFVGYYDDEFESELINGFPVLGNTDDLNGVDYELYVVIALGTPSIKKKIINSITNSNIKFPVLIHPSVIMGNHKWLTIGDGTIVCAGCILTVNIDIGKHVILNLGCTVGHDAIIGDFSSFMPSVNISGEVIINEGVYIGTGSKIINQLEIGHNTTVGAGAVVTKTLPSNSVCVGVPAKPIKK